LEKSYYREYYHIERNHWWFRVREKILLNRLKTYLKPNSAILNIGAATARSSEALSALGKVVSLEYDADCVAFVKEKTGLELIEGSVLELPFSDQSFEVVCAFDVIEHVDDDSKAVCEMLRVCKKGGLVMLSVPAYQMLWSAHDEINQHYRRYTLQSLCKLFENQEAKILYKSYFNTLLFPAIALVRMLSKRKNEKISDFEQYKTSGLSGKILFAIFSLELILLKFMRFGFGVSAMLVLRKT
jgi:ubiquinone/menaquinone biosynthesis C-methylase UbiE